MRNFNRGIDIKGGFSRRPVSSTKKFQERIPTIVALVVGLGVGFLVDGSIGVVVAIIAGMLVMKVFGRLRIPVRPWQSLAAFLLPIVGRALLIIGLLLPFGNGLTLATGEYPDTLPKYLSIAVLKPQNLMATSGKYWGMPDYYPGAPLLVIVSMILMFVGSLRMQKMKYVLFYVVGLVLFMLSPTISYLISTGKASFLFYLPFFQIGFYLSWAAVVLVVLSNILHNRLRIGPPLMPTYGTFALVSAFPVAMGLYIIDGLASFYFNLPMIRVLIDITQDFEEAHHLFADGFSGIISGIGGGEIVDDVWEDAMEAPPEEEPVYEAPPTYGVPVPSTDPNDPPGTTFQYNPDGTTVKKLPDGIVSTKYTDGTVYVESPDGSTYTIYPDGTEKGYTPDGTLETTYPDGTTVTNMPDGRVDTIYPDGTRIVKAPSGQSVTIHPGGEQYTLTQPDGSSETFDSNFETVSKTFGPQLEGITATKNPDGTWTLTSTYGGSMTVDKNGNLNGSIIDNEGAQITGHPDGTKSAKLPDGTLVTIEKDGSMSVNLPDGSSTIVSKDGSFSVKGKDGSAMSIDKEGNLTEGHFELDDGRTVDVDSKGNMTVKDKEGNSAVIKPDGSIDFTDVDGGKVNIGPDDSGSFKTHDGYSGVTKPDGSTTLNHPNGTSVTMNPDGSLTLKTPEGKTITIPAEELNSIKQ